MNIRPRLKLALGIAVWGLAAFAAGQSMYVVYASQVRQHRYLRLQVEGGMPLAPGDMVYLMTDAGLTRAGEVAPERTSDGFALLAIKPQIFEQLNESVVATVWRTPLDAEEAINALLPPAIQRQAAEQIATDWQLHQRVLTRTWTPLAMDLAGEFVETIEPDVRAAIRNREERLWAIAEKHADALAEQWPAIEARVTPVIANHLAPVVRRLMQDALSEAPKVSIVWHVARGRHAEAFQILSDWLADYLVNLPPYEQRALSEALTRTIEEIANDAVVMGRLERVGEGVLADEEIGRLVREIYHEAIRNNPRVEEFVDRQIVNSPKLRTQFYNLIELFAPTARRVAAMCLFDEHGVTRPEIVHLARSIALNRQITWVRLDNLHSAPPLEEGSVLAAAAGGSTND